MIKKIIRKSCYGTEYSVPENMVTLFREMDENIENAEFGSDEEQNAIDAFSSEFKEYEKVYV